LEPKTFRLGTVGVYRLMLLLVLLLLMMTMMKREMGERKR